MSTIEPIFMCSHYKTTLDFDNSRIKDDILSLRNSKQYDNPAHTFNEDSDYPTSDAAKELIALIEKDVQTNICPTYQCYSQWSHIMPPNESTAPHSHVHPQFPSALSFVYYVDVPKDCGDLMFTFTVETKRIVMPVQPKENMLLVFPDYITHYTLPNRSTRDRISVSGNLIPDYEKLEKTNELGNLINIIGLTS